jgi:hypothetical protein
MSSSNGRGQGAYGTFAQKQRGSASTLLGEVKWPGNLNLLKMVRPAAPDQPGLKAGQFIQPHPMGAEVKIKSLAVI